MLLGLAVGVATTVCTCPDRAGKIRGGMLVMPTHDHHRDSGRLSVGTRSLRRMAGCSARDHHRAILLLIGVFAAPDSRAGLRRHEFSAGERVLLRLRRDTSAEVKRGAR